MKLKKNDWEEYKEVCLAKTAELDKLRRSTASYDEYIYLSSIIEEYLAIARDAERQANKNSLSF